MIVGAGGATDEEKVTSKSARVYAILLSPGVCDHEGSFASPENVSCVSFGVAESFTTKMSPLMSNATWVPSGFHVGLSPKASGASTCRTWSFAADVTAIVPPGVAWNVTGVVMIAPFRENASLSVAPVRDQGGRFVEMGLIGDRHVDLVREGGVVHRRDDDPCLSGVGGSAVLGLVALRLPGDPGPIGGDGGLEVVV